MNILKTMGAWLLLIMVALMASPGMSLAEVGGADSLATLGGAIGFGGVLAADRQTPRQGTGLLSLLVSAATKCYAGGIAVINGGYVEPGTTALGLVAVGRFNQTVDNSTGAAGDLRVEVNRGEAYRWLNSAAADEITQADLFTTCYIVDDETVAKTDGAGTRSVAGTVVGVDAGGVFVEIK